MNFLDLPENVLYRFIKRYLRLRDWCSLAIVCSRLRDVLQACWIEKRQLLIDKDVLSLNPFCGNVRFYIAQDNLWPQRLYKSNNYIDAQLVRDSYRELWFLLRRCNRLQAIRFCSNGATTASERRVLGGSVLSLFSQRSFYMVTVLNLSNTMFSLHDLEETAPGFSNIVELRLENCRIYINQNRAWNESPPSKTLQRFVIDYSKLKWQMCLGVKVLLISCSQIFNELQYVYTGKTEFQSTGCIVYSFGREEATTVYQLCDLPPQWWDRISCCY